MLKKTIFAVILLGTAATTNAQKPEAGSPEKPALENINKIAFDVSNYCGNFGFAPNKMREEVSLVMLKENEEKLISDKVMIQSLARANSGLSKYIEQGEFNFNAINFLHAALLNPEKRTTLRSDYLKQQESRASQVKDLCAAFAKSSIGPFFFYDAEAARALGTNKDRTANRLKLAGEAYDRTLVEMIAVEK